MAPAAKTPLKKPPEPPQQSSDLVILIDTWVTSYLQDWQVAGIGAVAAISTPPIPESSDYWYDLLTGNTSWAFAGILIGDWELIPLALFAGIGEALTHKGGGSTQAAPSGKDQVNKALALARDEVVKAAEKKIPSWSQDLHQFRQEQLKTKKKSDFAKLTPEEESAEINLEKEFIWNKMFAKTRFDNHNATLQAKMLTRINAALADFNRQYRNWYDTGMKSCTKNGDMEEERLKRLGYFQVKHWYGYERPDYLYEYSQELQHPELKSIEAYCEYKNPFKPKLNFPLDE